MKILFLFLDGLGLGEADPQHNPLVRARMPHLRALLDGQPLAGEIFGRDWQPGEVQPLETERALLIPLDACLGIDGRPQSATGQASLLTGLNIPAMLGHHYGPKPNRQVANYLQAGNLFAYLRQMGLEPTLLNAYPPRYFRMLANGRRLPGVIAMAARMTGIRLKTQSDLYQGQALSADLSGQGWRDVLGFADAPVLSMHVAGLRMAELALSADLSFFEYWPSDIAGHRRDMDTAVHLLESFDTMLSGLLAAWNPQDGLILITSDHGNLEDLRTRNHTRNPVPALIIGNEPWRRVFRQSIHDLTGITPAILQLFRE